MTTGRSNLVDITLERCPATTEKAAAFWQGDYDETGREVWVWLPLSQIEIEEKGGDTVEVTMPEWLAKDKGLI